MKSYLALTKALFLSALREPVGFFFLIVFAPGLAAVLGLIFGNDPQPQFGGVGFVDSMLPGIAVISVLMIGIMIVPQNHLSLRETGALTRLRATPLRPGAFIAADLTVNFALGMVGAILTLLVGVLGFGVTIPGSVLLMLVALALGLVAMLALGYALASIYPSVGAAVGVGNGLMIVLIMISGVMIPLAVMPEFVQTAAQFSPVFHIAELVDAARLGTAWPWTSFWVLVGIAVVCGVIGAWRFRWDKSR